jgi:hypothetical protein
MTFIDINPLDKNKTLYSIFTNVELQIIKKQKKESLLECAEKIKDDFVLLLNPELEELKMVIKYSGKQIYVAITNVNYEQLDVLKKVSEVIVFDNLDSKFLKQNGINHTLMIPSNLDKIKKEKKDKVLCITPLDDMSLKNLEHLTVLSKNYDVTYAGLKRTNSRYNFEKLIKLIYSNVEIIDYPLLDINYKIQEYKYLISHSDFPIDAYAAAKVGVIPFIVTDNRYYKWLPGKCHLDNAEYFLKVFEKVTLEDIKMEIEEHENLYNK